MVITDIYWEVHMSNFNYYLNTSLLTDHDHPVVFSVETQPATIDPNNLGQK